MVLENDQFVLRKAASDDAMNVVYELTLKNVDVGENATPRLVTALTVSFEEVSFQGCHLSFLLKV